jgi:uncharacterized protein (DUF1697 family)
MTTYAILMRGINVGGMNKVPMGKLKSLLEERGFEAVTTFMQSGNVILKSKLKAGPIARKIETVLPTSFTLDSSLIKVLALSADVLQAVVDRRPKGFGDQPKTYHSDAIFPMGITVAKAMTAFDPRDGVDTVWPGSGVIYHQRLSAVRTKTRLNKMMSSPLYKSMTIRSWGTTIKLLDLVKAADA